MTIVKLEWERFDNFFDLWRARSKSIQMIYSIGETAHCYIGCIGINDGKGGLRNRYQWQYVQRSLAIFAKEESEGQVAFAAKFISPDDIDRHIIKATEAEVQASYIAHDGLVDPLFETQKRV